MILDTLAQAAAAATQAISLSTVIESFAAVCALYLINLVLKLNKNMTSLMIALFGDPNVPASERTGALKKINDLSDAADAHATAFDAHVISEEGWQNGMYTAIHEWNEHAAAAMMRAEPIDLPALRLPKPPAFIERRKKPR